MDGGHAAAGRRYRARRFRALLNAVRAKACMASRGTRAPLRTCVRHACRARDRHGALARRTWTAVRAGPVLSGVALSAFFFQAEDGIRYAVATLEARPSCRTRHT